MSFYGRHIFEFNDTGMFGDTGPSMWGEIAQMRWSPDSADTGADLQLTMVPKRGDTGDGFLFYNDNDVLGADFVKVPVQPGHAADGTDTGVDEYFPVVAAGDRIRAKVISGATSAVTGRLYIWWRG